jgi:serine/threonine protein phosphatase 1
VAGRTLAIGDIHGCDVAFETLLKELAPTADDTVVILGDVVDRGPGTREVIERLLALRDACRFVFIRGNHEEMMLSARQKGEWTEGWLRYGGTATLFSYGGLAEGIPESHLDLLRSAIDYFETSSELFVHANLQIDVALDKQEPIYLRWMHLEGSEPPHPSGKRVICGHTSQKTGEPLVRPGWVCIDTYAHGSGWLTGLDVGTNAYVQANQLGTLRSGRLPEPE